MVEQKQLDTLLKENRVFKPKSSFSKKAHVSSMSQYRKMYNESIKTPGKFWSKVAKELSGLKIGKKFLNGKNHIPNGLLVEKQISLTIVLIVI